MRKLLLLVSLVVCAVTATTGSALAVDGARTVKPSAAQKLGIVKSINAGEDTNLPASCFTIGIAKTKGPSGRYLGAVLTKKTAACDALSDTDWIVYGRGGAWFTMVAANTGTLKAPQCGALSDLLGTGPWADLASYVSVMGCQNID